MGCIAAGFLGGEREGLSDRGALGEPLGRVAWRGDCSGAGWVWADKSLSSLSLSQHPGKLQNLLSLNCGAGVRQKACVCMGGELRRMAGVRGSTLLHLPRMLILECFQRFACSRRKKPVDVFLSLLRVALKYRVNRLQYLLFVAWLPPSPVSASLLNPFSLLSFYLY